MLLYEWVIGIIVSPDFEVCLDETDEVSEDVLVIWIVVGRSGIFCVCCFFVGLGGILWVTGCFLVETIGILLVDVCSLVGIGTVLVTVKCGGGVLNGLVGFLGGILAVVVVIML